MQELEDEGIALEFGLHQVFLMDDPLVLVLIVCRFKRLLEPETRNLRANFKSSSQ